MVHNTVLCKSRHLIKINHTNTIVEDYIFEEVCNLNIRELEYKALLYLNSLKCMYRGSQIKLNLYVTGFTPALVSFINMRNSIHPHLPLVVWHFDNKTRLYIPQEVL